MIAIYRRNKLRTGPRWIAISERDGKIAERSEPTKGGSRPPWRDGETAERSEHNSAESDSVAGAPTAQKYPRFARAGVHRARRSRSTFDVLFLVNG